MGRIGRTRGRGQAKAQKGSGDIMNEDADMFDAAEEAVNADRARMKASEEASDAREAAGDTLARGSKADDWQDREDDHDA